MIWGLHRSVSTNKSIDEILTISKDINNLLKHSAILTPNDLSSQILIQLNKTFSTLKYLHALFEEKGKPSSSKGEKDQETQDKATQIGERKRSSSESEKLKSPRPKIQTPPPTPKEKNPLQSPPMSPQKIKTLIPPLTSKDKTRPQSPQGLLRKEKLQLLRQINLRQSFKQNRSLACKMKISFDSPKTRQKNVD